MAVRAKNRRFPTAFKLKAIKRAEGGEGVLPVARKLARNSEIANPAQVGAAIRGFRGEHRRHDRLVAFSSKSATRSDPMADAAADVHQTVLRK